jgi:hypothetical protein
MGEGPHEPDRGQAAHQDGEELLRSSRRETVSYEAKKRADGYKDGSELWEFRGPGLNYFGTYPTYLLNGGEHQADCIVRMLAKAFSAGREHAKDEIRTVLGVPRDR